MTVETDALQRAIDYLGAVEVAPGRYAFRLHDEHHRWRVGTAEQIAPLDGKRLEAPMMPAWWSPERQYYYISLDRDGKRCDYGRPSLVPPARTVRVTVDLETGQEVST